MSCTHVVARAADGWCLICPPPAPSTEVTDEDAAAEAIALAEAEVTRYVAHRCRKSLAEFVRQSWHVLEPTTKLEWNWHHELICCALQEMFFDWQRAQADPTFKQRANNTIFNQPPGSLKPCYDRGMVIVRSRGLTELRAVEVGDEVLTHRGRFRRVLAVAEQGVLPLVEIRTGKGRVVKVAEDHPVLTARGWVEAGQVVVGDVLAEVHPKEPSGGATISLEEARFIGYLIGDGCLSQVQAASFTNQDAETLDDFSACAASLGFGTQRRSVRSTTIVSVKDNIGTKGRPKGVPGPVRAWVRARGMEKSTSYSKRVPREVMQGSDEIVLDYLAAYWACDGGIHDRRDLPRAGRPGQTTQTVRIGASTVSEGLARDHQALLSRVGLSFRLRRHENRKLKSKRQGDTYVSWDVYASDQDTAAKFMELIGPRMRHEKRGRAQGLRRTGFNQVLNADPVVAVERVGEGACRCLMVEEDSSFSYQGVAVHNSRIVSVCFPVWAWLHAPGFRVICLSVTKDAVYRDARYSRQLIQSTWYQTHFAPEWRLKDDQDAVSDYGNTAGGSRLSKPSGSEIVGLRGDCVAGETLVATEWGEISIKQIHEMKEKPRVWSVNHRTGAAELRAVQASRKIANRKVVGVRAESGHLLRCTGDHKIWTSGGYTEAKNLAGHLVSVVRSAVGPVARSGQEVRGLLDRGLGLRDVLEGVQAGGGGPRQGAQALPGRATDVLTPVRDGGAEAARRRVREGEVPEAVRVVRRGVCAEVLQGEQALLLAGVREREDGGDRGFAAAAREGVRALLDDVPSQDLAVVVLLAGVRESAALGPHGGERELEFQEGCGEALLRGAVGELGAAHQAEGRAPVRGLRHSGIDAQAKAAARAPHRSRPDAERTGEPDHLVRRVSHDAPQVDLSSAALVDGGAEGGGGEEVDVYDIQVEGNHNFFAGGLLVHNCLILDDPNNPLESHSEKARKQVIGLWDTNTFNRVNSMVTSLRVIVQQRTHELDLTGHVLLQAKKKGGIKWCHVCLPGEFDPKRRCVTPFGADPRATAGESIHPKLWPAEVLAAEAVRLGPYDFAGQVNQLPAPAEGGIFKKAWFGSVDRTALPVMTDVVISLDANAKKTKAGSRAALLVVGAAGSRRPVLGAAAAREELPWICQAFRDLHASAVALGCRPTKAIIEMQALGPAFVQTMREEIAALNMEIVETTPGDDKISRAKAVVPTCAAGNVMMLAGEPWVEEVTHEVCVFPNGANDDYMDSLSQALTYLAGDDSNSQYLDRRGGIWDY